MEFSTEEVAQPEQVPEQTVVSDCNAVNGYGWDTRIAYAVCMAESGGIASKDNAGLNYDGSVDYGLMQVNSIHAGMVGGDVEQLRDPQTNIRVAYAVYQGSLERTGDGWKAWSAYNNGKYLNFLN